MNFDMKNITTYLGCIVLAGFVIYVTTNMLSLNNKVIEGLTEAPSTPKQLLSAVATEKEKLVNELHIDKYKTQYHQMLLDVEDILHLQMLDELRTAIDKKKLREKETLSTLSHLESTKSALKDLDEFLTHFKSS